MSEERLFDEFERKVASQTVLEALYEDACTIPEHCEERPGLPVSVERAENGPIAHHSRSVMYNLIQPPSSLDYEDPPIVISWRVHEDLEMSDGRRRLGLLRIAKQSPTLFRRGLAETEFIHFFRLPNGSIQVSRDFYFGNEEGGFAAARQREKEFDMDFLTDEEAISRSELIKACIERYYAAQTRIQEDKERELQNAQAAMDKLFPAGTAKELERSSKATRVAKIFGFFRRK